MDFILLVDTGHKEVPSSEAHVRVRTSPHFAERHNRVEKRLKELKSLLLKPNSIPEIQKLVLDEALDMHDLFQTSEPSFKYMTALSEEIVESVPSQKFNAVVTMDAGANVHLFVPLENEAACESWIQKKYPQLKYIKDVTGYGASYE